MGLRKRKLIYNIIVGVILLLEIVITLYPVIWMVSGSLKSQQDFYTNICASSVSFGIFIMRSFFISLPKSLEEAALIDGCTPFKSFWKIILPLSVPGIMTQVIFNGLNTWNEYFMASIFLRDEKKYTLSIGIATMQNAAHIVYPELFAALCWVTLPMIVVYLICQKSFIEGIAAGAVKG